MASILADAAAERAVLGALLRDPGCIGEVWGMLDPTDFADDQYRTIVAAVFDMAGEGQQADLVTLPAYLRERGELNAAGGLGTISALVDELPDPGAIRHYAALIKKSSTRRRLVSLGERLRLRAADPHDQLRGIVDDAGAELAHLAGGVGEDGAAEAFDVVGAIVDRATRGAKPAEEPIRTGLQQLDGHLGGLHPDQLFVIAARVGVGKTALALQAATAAAFVGRSVLMASLEMGRTELAWRIIAQETGIPVWRVREGNLGAELGLVENARERLRGTRLLLADRGVMTPSALKARCRAWQLRRGLDLVVVDYLQLMKGGERYSNRAEEVSAISRALKLMARDLGVAVIACSQLNREPERRSDGAPVTCEGRRAGEPRLSDLRESGSIEADADLVLLLDRRIEGDPAEVRSALGILAKNRAGPTGRFAMRFDPVRVRFANGVPP